MKHLFKYAFFAAVITIVFSSCKKEENQVFYDGGTAPVLSTIATAALSPQLNQLNANSTALTFNWTNPNYKFTTGVSSQDVIYTLQIDLKGLNFSSAKIAEKQISKEYTTSLTVRELNTLIAGLGLTDSVVRNFEIRLRSTLANTSAPLYSNIYNISIGTYFDVVYPVPLNLYITGEATPLNWQCGCGADGPGTTQKFTKITSSKFELTVALNGGKSFLFLPVYGSWNAKYGFTGAGNQNNVNGDDFKPDGSDMKAPNSGTYKITVDFKTGKYSIQ